MTASPAAAPASAQSATPSKAPVAPKATHPAPTAAPSTVYVQPQPAHTVYVVPAPAPSTVIVTVPNTGIGGMDGANVYPINSEGALVNVRVNPSVVSAVIGTLYQDQYVDIACTQYGDPVTGPWGTTTLWDRIDSPYYGYVSDMFVNTSSGRPVVGSC